MRDRGGESRVRGPAHGAHVVFVDVVKAYLDVCFAVRRDATQPDVPDRLDVGS